MIKITQLCMLLTFSISLHAEIKTFQPSFTQFDAQAYSTRSFKIESIGTAKFKNNINIPVQGVAILNPFNEQEKYYREYTACRSTADCSYDYTISVQDTAQYKIVILSGIGAILSPKDWDVISSDMGPSGVASALLMNPKRDEAIELYNSSACAGCGMPYATLYFPEILKTSVENEFGAYKDRLKYLSLVRANKNKVFFSFKNPRYAGQSHGIALYSDDDITNFQNITVHLLPQHQIQARTVLNFFPFKYSYPQPHR